MKIEDRLFQAKDKIEEAKTNKAREEGKLQGLYDQLLQDFGSSSLEQAKKLLETIENKIAVKEAELREKMEDLETKYEWI